LVARIADLAASLGGSPLPLPGGGGGAFDTAPFDLDAVAVAAVGWDLAARIGAVIR
jgi:hypothetical protein